MKGCNPILIATAIFSEKMNFKNRESLLMWHNSCLYSLEFTLLYFSSSMSRSFWRDDPQSSTEYFILGVTGIMQRGDHSPWRASVYTAWKGISYFSYFSYHISSAWLSSCSTGVWQLTSTGAGSYLLSNWPSLSACLKNCFLLNSITKWICCQSPSNFCLF